MSLVARLILAFFSILFAGMTALWASGLEPHSLLDWIPAVFCLVTALMCIVKGRLIHFFGGLIATTVLVVGLAYLFSALRDHRSQPANADSIFGALAFCGVFGWLSVKYLLATRFGFAAPPKRMAEQVSVEFDQVQIRVVEAGDPAGWNQQFAWDDVVRVCFVDGGPYDSDYLFFTLRGQEKPRVVPTEANGGPELLGAVVERGLFPEDVWRKAIAETGGRTHCWPPHEEAATH